jgi:hypothetical protein
MPRPFVADRQIKGASAPLFPILAPQAALASQCSPYRLLRITGAVVEGLTSLNGPSGLVQTLSEVVVMLEENFDAKPV